MRSPVISLRVVSLHNEVDSVQSRFAESEVDGASIVPLYKTVLKTLVSNCNWIILIS